MTDLENIDDLAAKRRRNKKIEVDNTKQQMMKKEVLITLSEIENTEFPKEDETEHLRVGTAEMQGKRPFMEDAAINVCNFRGKECFFGVYDGHAGADSSKLVGKELHVIFENKLNEYFKEGGNLDSLTTRINAFMCFHQELFDPFVQGSGKRTVFRRDSMVDKKNYIEDSYEPIELSIMQEEECVQVLLRESFLEMSERIVENKLQNGTTAVVAYISGKNLYVAGAGDSRAVLFRDGNPMRLTKDHRGKDDDETRRVRELGGFVAGGRVNGVVSVSRAIGDNYLEPMLSADPCTNFVELTEKDTLLILGCDGVWDYVTEDEACTLIKDIKDPRIAALKLRDFAYEKGSTDNISCTVVVFSK